MTRAEPAVLHFVWCKIAVDSRYSNLKQVETG